MKGSRMLNDILYCAGATKMFPGYCLGNIPRFWTCHPPNKIINRRHAIPLRRAYIPARVGFEVLGSIDDGSPPQQNRLLPSKLLGFSPLKMIYTFFFHCAMGYGRWGGGGKKVFSITLL